MTEVLPHAQGAPHPKTHSNGIAKFLLRGMLYDYSDKWRDSQGFWHRCWTVCNVNGQPNQAPPNR